MAPKLNKSGAPAVARGGVEPPTYRFSGGRSYQLSYLAVLQAPESGACTSFEVLPEECTRTVRHPRRRGSPNPLDARGLGRRR